MNNLNRDLTKEDLWYAEARGDEGARRQKGKGHQGTCKKDMWTKTLSLSEVG